MNEKEKAFQEKEKRFNKNVMEILANIAISMLVTIVTLKKLGTI